MILQKYQKNIDRFLKDITNEIIVSSISIWEIAIKISIKKLILPFELKNILNEIDKFNLNILEISSEHLIKVADLPFFHEDPFDRLIISQAIIENLPVISSDNNFDYYQIKTIW